MHYTEFKNLILNELKQNPDGLSWKELKTRLSLPYDSPCPTWVNRLETENGLARVKGSGRSYLWRIKVINTQRNL